MKYVAIALTCAVFSTLAFARAQAAEKAIIITGSTSISSAAEALGSEFARNTGIPVMVTTSNSGQGAKLLAVGTSSIAAMSRTMNLDEIDAARANGIEPNAHFIAFGALVIVVNQANPVTALKVEELHRLYSGACFNWKELGGVDEPVILVRREYGSGTQETFTDMVMGQANPMTASALIEISNKAVRRRVAETPGAIGFISHGFLDATVKSLSINGVTHSTDAILNETYPLTRSLYFYTDGKPEGNVSRFLKLTESMEGKQILSNAGFVTKP
ncbi:phosphate ABC transporter substrate-binding protein [Pelodictyon luteolum]|nr:phosphate ABC transporter substrate-binding protein [Pelodictyon luteolum]